MVIYTVEAPEELCLFSCDGAGGVPAQGGVRTATDAGDHFTCKLTDAMTSKHRSSGRREIF